jgi:HD-like signal output (HDOD) protein
MPEKKHILFVDDDPSVLDGLRRMLRPMHNEWDLAFAASGQEALDLMGRQPVDVIISDMRMPKMNGAQLLEEVQKRYPHVVRIILSGYSNRELTLRSVGPAHQYLAKPCDTQTLIDTVRRSSALREHLTGPRLRRVVAQIGSLPVLPTVYSDLTQALTKDDVTMADVGRIIGRDVGMTAKILQVINSAFFGLRQKVEDPSRAVFFLGLDTVKALVLSMGVFRKFDSAAVTEFSIEALHHHCLRVGAIARRISQEIPLPRQDQNDSFTAGILHGIGRLILISDFREEFRRSVALSQEHNRRLTDAEMEILGTTHGELGGYLLGLWGIPDTIVEAVSLHTNPQSSPGKIIGPLTMVHVANAIDRELCGDELPGGGFGYDMDYLDRLELTGKLERWREFAASMIDGSREVLAGVGHAN